MPAMLVGAIPHRRVSAERPEGVCPIPPRLVAYLCGQCELTTSVPMHPQAPIPALWPCRRCREPAECTEEPDEGAELLGTAKTSRNQPPKSHWAQLKERRSEKELERLLDSRLALLRTGKLHSGPSHR